MQNKDEILRYLDSVAAKVEATDKKKAKAMKEKAKKNAEKIIKVIKLLFSITVCRSWV